jgi:hypothetical protein
MTSFTIQSTVADLLDHQTTKLHEAEQELSLCDNSIKEYKAKEVSLETELQTEIKAFLDVFGIILIHSIKTKLTNLYMSKLTSFERLLFPYLGSNKDVITPDELYKVLDIHRLYNLKYVQFLNIDNLYTLSRSNLIDATKELIKACEFVGIECYITQLEAVIQHKNNYSIQKILNRKKEIDERICSLNNVIKILSNLPLTQTVTYQVTYDGSCSIK